MLRQDNYLLNLNLYDFHARNYDPAIGRWLSVDPLAEKYPSWTPYHYVHQNSINLIDPTGMEADHIIIRGEKENYHYDENDKYTGNDKFIKATLSAIDEIKKSSTGSDMINELDASDNIFYIQSGSTNSFKPTLESFADPSKATESTKKFSEQGKIGSGGVINWNEQDMRIPTTTSDLSSKEIILGHEMAHALDSNRGKLDRTLENGVKRSEWQAVYRENLIRSELNLPLRTHYGRELEVGTDKYLGPLKPRMLGKKNEIIKPYWYE